VELLSSPIASAVVGSIVGALSAIAAREWLQHRTNERVRRQIRYLLKSLSVQMAMARDYPLNKIHGFELVFPRLVERALSSDGARALTRAQSDALLDAISETEQSIAFLRSERAKFLKNPSSFREAMIAAARRSFNKLGLARDALDDASELRRPSDPRNLHQWKPGAVIERER
jgi:hypothetical protein